MGLREELQSIRDKADVTEDHAQDQVERLWAKNPWVVAAVVIVLVVIATLLLSRCSA